jgi:hypothetical protein
VAKIQKIIFSCIVIFTTVFAMPAYAHTAEAQIDDGSRAILETVRRYAETPVESIAITDVNFGGFGVRDGILGELRRFYESIDSWLAGNVGISISSIVQFTVGMFTKLFSIVIDTVTFIFNRVREGF